MQANWLVRGALELYPKVNIPDIYDYYSAMLLLSICKYAARGSTDQLQVLYTVSTSLG